MKTTKKSIKLEKEKLFGFNQPGSGKKGSKTIFARPMIGSKAVGSKVPPQ
ncbi:MAG TPA: hypothetical protein VF607_11335 [Verrucomicrobiae bacterium]